MSDKILITACFVFGLLAVAATIPMVGGLLLLNFGVAFAGFVAMVIFAVICAGTFIAAMTKELYK